MNDTTTGASGSVARGSVALVGGGPGHPDLITVLGRQLLSAADVVIVDRLGPRALLDDLAPGVEVIDVGKRPNHHPVPQSRINELLVEHARAGKRVVRLKGGDPFVFGRGGEEAEYCRAEGVQVRVVPGVTSAVAVPQIAGIPVTHRGVAAGFTVLAAHTDIDEVPGGSDHTVVLLMGVSGLAATAALLAAGRRGEDCPVAIVEDGYGDGQRVTVGTLGTIAAEAAALGVQSPAVIVVGDVVRLADTFVSPETCSIAATDPVEFRASGAAADTNLRRNEQAPAPTGASGDTVAFDEVATYNAAAFGTAPADTAA